MGKEDKKKTSTATAVADPPAKETKQEKPAEPEVVMITSTDLAKRLNTKPTILRRWLRSLPHFQDGGYTRYKWDPNDPFLKDAEASFAKYQRSTEEKKEAREKEAREKSEKKAAEKSEKKPAKGKASKADPEPEESDEEEVFDDGESEEELS